jgi:hypothetical protein
MLEEAIKPYTEADHNYAEKGSILEEAMKQ